MSEEPEKGDQRPRADLDKVLALFGCTRITEDIVTRVEHVTKQRAHRFLRRDVFVAHRDLNLLLDAYVSGRPFYVYTGRGPSSASMHVGHLVPFLFTKYLQDAFKVPVVIQITDDEKYVFRPDLELGACVAMGKSNAKDILALGFDPARTFLFSDVEYIHRLYPTVLAVQKAVTGNQIRGIFGFDGSDNVGKVAFPAVQAAPCFPEAFPLVLAGCPRDAMCLVPQAIDQDPYFRMARDVAPRLGCPKPALIHSKFLPSLQSATSKMSSSHPDPKTSTIFLSDGPDVIAEKIKRHAFSGGQATAALHRELGATVDDDVAYQYLTFFLEDDAELETIRTEYAAGRMMTGEVKARVITVLQDLVGSFQTSRVGVTDEVLAGFTAERPLEFA